jgi:hypothetical protein
MRQSYFFGRIKRPCWQHTAAVPLLKGSQYPNSSVEHFTDFTVVVGVVVGVVVVGAVGLGVVGVVVGLVGVVVGVVGVPVGADIATRRKNKTWDNSKKAMCTLMYVVLQ